MGLQLRSTSFHYVIIHNVITVINCSQESCQRGFFWMFYRRDGNTLKASPQASLSQPSYPKRLSQRCKVWRRLISAIAVVQVREGQARRNLGETWMQAVPPWLTDLYMCCSLFARPGPLPDWLGRLSQLRRLLLGGNKFSGEKAISAIKHTTFLDLDPKCTL